MHADANIGTCQGLIASRARIVAAADEARPQMELDLHDGIRQQLISLGFALRMTRGSVPSELDRLRQELGHIMFGLAATSRRYGTSPVEYIRRSYRLVGPARR